MRTTEWLVAEARARDFYAKFGFVFSRALALEKAVAGVLCAHLAFTQSGRIPKEKIFELRKKIEKKTLRPLIEEMKLQFEFRDSDLDKLELALRYRNDLAHGFLWRNSHIGIAPNGLEKLTVELDEMMDVILEATTIADGAYRALLMRAGLDTPEQEAAFQRHLGEEYSRIVTGK